jgi:transposase
MQFGRRSEQMGTLLDQIELELEELETSDADIAAGLKPTAAPVPRKPARQPLPDHLPREPQVHSPPHACCPDCGGALRLIGQDISEMLEYVPARFKVIRQIRPKLACSSCDTIVQVLAPSRPIARGYAGPGLLAHVTSLQIL